MRGSDGRFAAFHLMTEAEERRSGRRNVRLSTLPHYPSSLLLFPPLPSLPPAPPFPSPFPLLFLLLCVLFLPHPPILFLPLLLLRLVNSFRLQSSFNWSLAGDRPHLRPQQHVSQTHKQTQTMAPFCLCVVVNYQRRADVDYSGRFVR